MGNKVEKHGRMTAWGCFWICIAIMILIFILRFGSIYLIIWGNSARFQLSDGVKIINAIHSGQLKVEHEDTIFLPARFDYGFRTHQVYITHGANGLTLVYFPIFDIMSLGGARGYIYCSRPLTKADTTLFDNGQPWVQIRVPYYSSGPPNAPGTFRPLTREINPHWYYTEILRF